MLNDRLEKAITEQLGGAIDNCIRDANLFGSEYAQHEYHLGNFNVWDFEDWYKKRTGREVLLDRGILHSPLHGRDYARDILQSVLEKFSEWESQIKELRVENERLKQAIAYHRSHPLDACNELINKIVKEGTPNDNKRRH